MTKEPFIAYSEMTDEIYIICGTEKYLVTEQVIKAMQDTGRLAQPTSDDCVSRKQAKIDVIPNSLYTSEQVIALLDNLSPVTPTHGTCKDCRNYVKGALDEDICQRGHELIHEDFYCKDFEKRGNENGNW